MLPGPPEKPSPNPCPFQTHQRPQTNWKWTFNDGTVLRVRQYRPVLGTKKKKLGTSVLYHSIWTSKNTVNTIVLYSYILFYIWSFFPTQAAAQSALHGNIGIHTPPPPHPHTHTFHQYTHAHTCLPKHVPYVQCIKRHKKTILTRDKRHDKC